jgi:hypothetical protein
LSFDGGCEFFVFRFETFEIEKGLDREGSLTAVDRIERRDQSFSITSAIREGQR